MSDNFPIDDALSVLMTELVFGAPDPAINTYMLNRGDEGLVKSLERLSAREAAAASHGGASIAAHVDHLRYGLSLMNAWAAGAPEPWKNADWTQSWKRTVANDDEWRALTAELDREARTWIDTVAPRERLTARELTWTLGSVAHLAYHLGAIRQISRGARGPTAEDEQRYTKGVTAPSSTEPRYASPPRPEPR